MIMVRFIIYLSSLFAATFLISCDRAPMLFSVNNFNANLDDSAVSSVVKLTSTKGIEGTWLGMEHEIKVLPDFNLSPESSDSIPLKSKQTYTIQFIDTANNKTLPDTTEYKALFIKINGQIFLEIISEGTNNTDHDLRLEISTYLKINKITPDTVIVQMPESKFTEAYLKANGYHYFILTESKTEKVRPLYLTEDPQKLALLLKNLCKFPKAFQMPDTILRKH
jgi:hypothetical protein